VRLSKKFAAIAITATAALTASAAFAAWTAGGSGSGSAKAGQAVSLSTGSASATTTLLYPSGSGDVNVNIHNPNPYQVTVTAINNGTGAISSGVQACDASNSVTFTNQTGSFVVAANSEHEYTLSGAAHMSSASVDACQNAVFSIPVSLVGASS